MPVFQGSGDDHVVFIKNLDKATPKLMEYAVMEKVFRSVDIEFCHTGDNPSGTTACFFSLSMMDVVVESCLFVGKTHQELPQEEITLKFESIQVKYTEITPEGMSMGDIIVNWVFQ